MPSRNINKQNAPESYYHIYARGASKQAIFQRPSDYEFLIRLFGRYLSTQQTHDKVGTPYPHFAGKVELLAYCLMGNHYHLLLFQKDTGHMAAFMRSVMTSYSRYFNNAYERSGPLFESRYKASLVTSEDYLEHISRYIHLNPRYWRRYPYSSFIHYKHGNQPEWLHPQKIVDMFDNGDDYLQFVASYESRKNELDEIKQELADK